MPTKNTINVCETNVVNRLAPPKAVLCEPSQMPPVPDPVQVAPAHLAAGSSTAKHDYDEVEGLSVEVTPSNHTTIVSTEDEVSPPQPPVPDYTGTVSTFIVK